MTDREVRKIAVALADELERRGMVAAAGRSAQTRKEPRTCAGEIHESLDPIATETDGGSSSSREAAALLAKLRAKQKRSASNASLTANSSKPKR